MRAPNAPNHIVEAGPEGSVMKNQTLSWYSIMVILGVSLPAFAAPVAPPRNDGLVQIDSRTLDEVYVRPDTNFQDYRNVIVEPGGVALRKGWLKSINATRGPSRWLLPEDAQNITDNATASLSRVVTESFRARGYEVVTTPAAGVLRVTPRVTDLNVNAPDVSSAYMQALFNIDAGEATLSMEFRDAATGELLGQIVDRGTAHALSSRINRTFNVTNAFWFDALFTQWTANCVAALKSAKLAN